MPVVYQVSEIARPNYYDRQPFIVNPYYSAVLAPHGVTVRWSYTPPFYIATFIEALRTFCFRSTAAGALTHQEASFQIIPYLGVSSTFLLTFFSNNVPNTETHDQLTTFGYMAYGDVLTFSTANFDTGGTVLMSGAMKGTEFVY